MSFHVIPYIPPMKELASPEEVAAMGQFLIGGSVWRLALQIHFTLEQLGSASPTGSQGAQMLGVRRQFLIEKIILPAYLDDVL